MLALGCMVSSHIGAQSLNEGFGSNHLTVKSSDLQISIYPNPTTDFVKMSFDGVFEGSYRVNNILGKNLKEGVIMDRSLLIDLSDLKTGMYLLSIYNIEQKKITTRKIIKN